MDHQEAVSTLAAERYLLGEMTAAERDAFEAHYFDCADCADDMRAGAAMRAGVRSGYAATLAMPARRSRRTSIVIPWAAAATFAIIAGYESMRAPSMGTSTGSGGPLALAPITLRSATRGQEVAVTPGAGGLVTLALDLSGERFDGGIQYELHAADGRVVASGRADEPASGAPLLLIVPADRLKSSAHYILTLHDSRNAGLTRGDYRFSVEAR